MQTDSRLDARELKSIQRRAKQLSRTDKSKTYMQHLDAECQKTLGSRFQDAKKHADTASPLAWYLQACQDAYLDI